MTTGKHVAKRLDHALADWLPDALGRPISKAKGRKLIMAGAVYLNGRPVWIPSTTLMPGMTIEAYVDLAKLLEDSTVRDKRFELTPDRILFEDEDLIVIDKPAGLPAQPTLDKSRDNLFAAVGRFLTRRDGVVKAYVGVHQRLDRDTSGVVLFTKSGRVNAAVAEIFSKRQAVKIYQAITVARPNTGPRSRLEKQWVIKNYLGRVASKSKRARYGAVRVGEVAETSFRVIAEHPRGIWIEAIPKTGRTHQIRVHLAEYGLPILGDDLYGANNHAAHRDELAPRLMLHAVALIFPHPMSGFKVSVKSSLPLDFEECLRKLKTRAAR